ncbi:16S rRNA (cytosine(967)-C(5))-methyltransferase RsmB [Rhodoferax mekongensis]|uniref:16S rRNA (cytosine(967)-C(5))-methyltransferase RsmB n=1 Tax=Rhodoferax mekongensis TaxID=3068341 RepID=UPI0028BE4F05|nr:16S rRNA (cytosine(967)-C(5))-methyltransferase RsmB [Rhodoferax sp. TBRC 17199]MDT7514216.1 16S rRNA (cytosine(967)-C(5))-methyltransferase RsmB [Rhodoferax sp. TBRC 17199]
MTENERTPPLWRQLQATVEVLKEVAAGVSGSVAMERVPTQLRGGVQALSFHAWRNMGRAKAIRALLAKRPPPADVDALLCLVLALLWDPSQVLYDDFTLVNQAVESAKKTPNTSAQASFINACLRRFLRERDALIAATEDRPEARWNHPAWWIKRVKQEHPQHWQAILQNANRHPPMTLRVNVRKIQGADYAQKLKDAGVEVARTSGSLIELSHPVPVTELPGFADGWVSVQDGAAQWAAKLLLAGVPANAQAKVLDACAAPGGKTAHLLEISDAEVLALEIDSQRTERIYQTLNRLGLSATVKTADAAHPETWWNGSLFDYVLLDAPCTASGIARRHPDIRWLRRESDVLQLAAEQRKLLAALWPTLKPGGKLLYCTCSIFRAEGSEQVKSFLDSNRDAVLLPSPGHLLPQSGLYGQDVADNWQGDHDGFFYALFEKKHF